MTHLKPVNRKAARIERATDNDVVALQRRGGGASVPQQPHFPVGCSLVFSPGWEADRTGGTAGLCQPVERDRLPHRVLLARAGAGSTESCAGLDEQVRRRPEGLAQDRSDLPITRLAARIGFPL